MKLKPYLLAIHVLSVITPGAFAQDYAIPWYSMDNGGAIESTGGTVELSGSIGQTDAGPALSGGTYTLNGGFWPGAASGPICIADFNGDGSIDIFDVFAFITAFNNGDPSVDLDGNGSIDIFDVFAYINLFNAGCE
jgi:uncharacterized membrane protein